MDVSQYMSMFLEESLDNLQNLNESLLQLEQNPEDIVKLNEIFRAAHTLKGMAATMGYSSMAELTHKMEDVLSSFREGELKVTQEVVTVLFDCLDTLERILRSIEEDNSESVDIQEIMSSLENITSKDINAKEDEGCLNNEEESSYNKVYMNEYDLNIIKQAKDKGYNTYEINIVLSENTLLKSARAFLVFKSLEEQGEIIKSLPGAEDIENENFEFDFTLVYITNSSEKELINMLTNISEVDKVSIISIELNNVKQNKKSITEQFECEASSPIERMESKDIDIKGEAAKKHVSAREGKKVHQSVRVDLERLDMLMNMVSELVIHRTRMEQLGLTYKSPEMNETLEQVARTTSDLQDLVMKIRMLPLEVVFNRFPRMIRDLSVELNKEMDFIIEGQDTELDRTVIDEIGEPLIHLLRNAADHGIESREARIAAGKNPVGKIKLVSYQEGTKAVIRVEDDGAGIDVEKVRQKAERIGISTDGMSPSDIRNLIFMEGFSTNEKVTDVSGRGVGMDVVKTKISSLGGTVDVISDMGKGSAFIIKLPLTLQIIQALLVKVHTETFAISLGYIDRVIDYKKENVKKSNGKEVLLYRDTVIPLVRVNERLGLEGKTEGKQFVIIVNVGEKTVGVLVDSLQGQQEIVIKPLGKTLQSVKEYIGA
ncbi:chemotaxis protein CheA, partial [Clostridium polynesiense]|uniref:chemotaxis protein CheA n=1 Tax=Clostridium polynesiense TaxID=1325933 RepID=UPI00058E5532